MDKTFRLASSFEEAEEADYSYLASLPYSERWALAMKLMEPIYASHPRLERIYRVVEYSQSPVSDSWGLGSQHAGMSKDDRRH